MTKELGGQFTQLEEATIVQLQAAMASGQLTARRLVEMYLERIQVLDHRAPGLNSILQINPDALTIADALDQERITSGPRGPLHGIPLLLKDNIRSSSCGSSYRTLIAPVAIVITSPMVSNSG